MSVLPPNLTALGSHQSLYNIGAVSRLTGIAMATLRAWERRYNFPNTNRSAGGQRLYSESDIIRLGWVQARVAEGMQPSQAVLLLHHLESMGQFSAELAGGQDSVPEKRAPAPEKRMLASPGATVAYLVDLLARGDLDHADQVLAEALAYSSPEALILDVIRPALAAIGECWEAGHMDVAAEHLATHYLRQKLTLWMVSSPPPLPRPPVVLACAPQEWHDGSLLILGALLRRRRIPVVYLGQALPLPDLAVYCRATHPALVVLVAMTDLSVRDLLDLPVWIPEVINTKTEIGGTVIGFGGRVFVTQPEWQLRIPGVYLGDTLETCLETIERLL